MKALLCILLFLKITAGAQDRLYLRNGETRNGQIISVGKTIVYFKASDTSAVEPFDKRLLLLAEEMNGTRYIFTDREEGVSTSTGNTGAVRRNSLGLQPLGIMAGRLTFVYERLSDNGLTGIVLPFSLTFDPYGPLLDAGLDSSQAATERISGFSFITGIDLNFYVGEKPGSTFFLGPRLRYGTDLFLQDIEGFTIQTQFGWRIGSPSRLVTQHLSVGMGIARMLSAPVTILYNPRQFYGWYSVNYRLGFNW